MSISYQNWESRALDLDIHSEPFSFEDQYLKGVFAKNERTKVKVEKYSMVIAYILTSICSSKSGGLLKKTQTEEGSVHINIQKVAVFDSDRKQNQFNSKQIFINLYSSIFFSTHLNVDDTS